MQAHLIAGTSLQSHVLLAGIVSYIMDNLVLNVLCHIRGWLTHNHEIVAPLTLHHGTCDLKFQYSELKL